MYEEKYCAECNISVYEVQKGVKGIYLFLEWVLRHFK